MSNTAPLGYKRVEYLESTGTQYIDTGVYGNLNTKTEIKASISSNTQTYQQLFGSIGTNNSITINIGSGNLVRFGSKQYNLNAYDYITIDVPSIFLINKNNINIDGEDTGSFNETNNFTTESTMYLMAANGSTSLKFNGKVYYCKIYDNDVLVRDYIPVLNENNEAGLYDLVNKEFYGNSRTGSFQYGNIIPEGTIAEKFNYSLEVKELIKDGINYLGGNVTDETTLKEYRDELDSVYSKLPKVSNSTASDNVTLNPTLKGRIDSTMYGQIGQDTTTGKNKLDMTKLIGANWRGGSIGSEGQLVATSDLTTYIEMENNEYYTFSGNLSDVNSNTVRVYVSNTIPTVGVTVRRENNFYSGNFTYQNVDNYKYLILSFFDVTQYNENYKWQLEKGNTSSSYEPYTGRNTFTKSKL